MKEALKYDADLQMYVSPPKELNLKYLIFLRQLVEKGRLEHTYAGLPVGNMAARAILKYNLPIEQIVRRGIPSIKNDV